MCPSDVPPAAPDPDTPVAGSSAVPRDWDAIVIGSGLGGLSAAALMARAGRRVLVLERHPAFGGAATVYQEGALAIEASLHETDALGIDDPAHGLLHRLGAAARVSLLEIPDGVFYEVRGPMFEQPFRLPSGFAAACAATRTAFPGQAAAIGRYFDTVESIGHVFSLMGDGDGVRIGEVLKSLAGGRLIGEAAHLARHARHSLSESMQLLLGDDEALKLALAANLAYLDDDPDRVWFPAFAMVQGRYLRDGGRYLHGGSAALVRALLEEIAGRDGQALAQAQAESILVDRHGRVAGVRWRDARGAAHEVHAPIVLGNAAPALLADMLPEPLRGTFGARYAGLAASVSLFTLSLGIDGQPADHGVTAYSTFVQPDWMHSLRQARDSAPLLGADPAGRLPAYALVDYGRLDTGLNVDGPKLLSLAGVDRLSNWANLDAAAMRDRKARWADALVADVERRFPGLGARVVQRSFSNAVSMQRYLGSPEGAVYGFAPSRERYARSPGPATAVPGLFLASAHTTGGGFAGAMAGGALAARAALARIEHDALARVMGSAHL